MPVTRELLDAAIVGGDAPARALGHEVTPGWVSFRDASRATRAMVAEAFSDQQVIAVTAHTLPERQVSNRVLEKLGFSYDGEDREDGEPVWR